MKNFVVTGASRGIGLATVTYLLTHGHRVFALSRSPLPAELSNLDATKSPSGVEKLHWLSSRANDMASSVQSIKDALDGEILHGVVHNAGVLLNKHFSATTEEDWQEQFEVNVFMVFRWTRALESLLDAGSHIVHISSMGGVQGTSKFPGLSLYSAAKGAISVFTESLSTEWVHRGISVNALALGAVQTEMLQEAFPGMQAPVEPDEMGAFIGDFCLKGHRLFNGKVLQVAMQNPA